MSGRLTLFAFAVALLLPIGMTEAQEGVLLRYKFSKEEPAIYRTTNEMNQTMQVEGQSFDQKVTQTEVNAISLAEMTKAGDLKLRYANKRLSAKADMGPAGTYAFDSESSEREKGTALSRALNPVFETLSGVEYYVTITPEGKVEKLDGYKEILENLTKDNPLAAQFTGGGSEEAQKASLAEVFFVLAEKPVQTGDTWETPIEMEFPKIGKAKGKRVYKFEGPAKKDDNKIVKISLSLELSFDFDLTTEGAKVTGNIGTDSSKGEIRFDTEQGQVVSAALEYTLSGNINTIVGDRTLKLTLKQKQTRSTTRLTELPK